MFMITGCCSTCFFLIIEFVTKVADYSSVSRVFGWSGRGSGAQCCICKLKRPRPWMFPSPARKRTDTPVKKWLCFGRRKNAELCWYISGKAADMARFADYFIVVGNDQEKAGKFVGGAKLRFVYRPSVSV